MNIGIFSDTYYPQINGVVTSIRMLEKELTKRGHTVYIFTTSDPNAKTEEKNVYRLPSVSFILSKSHRLAIAYPPRLLLKMKRFRLDIIHTQTEFPLGIFGKIVSEFLNIPILHTYHTMYEDYMHYFGKFKLLSPDMAKKYSRIFCNRCDYIITPVQKTKESLISYGVKKSISVIPTGIDFEPFMPNEDSHVKISEIKKELGVPEGKPVMVSIARVAREKSIDVLVRSMPELLKKIPDLIFVLVGDGPQRLELIELAKDLGVDGSIVFAGSRPWAEIGKYYQLGDIFACASTSETQGLTYIEAIAAKTPVVCKRDRSIEGIIVNGVTGYCFEKNEDCAEAIFNTLQKTKEELREVAEAAYLGIQDISSEKFAENILAVYEEVLEKRRINKKKRKLKSLKLAFPFQTILDKIMDNKTEDTIADSNIENSDH